MPTLDLLEPPTLADPAGENAAETPTTSAVCPQPSRITAPPSPSELPSSKDTVDRQMLLIAAETIIAATAIWAVARYRIFPERFATPMVILLVTAVLCGTSAWILRQRVARWFEPRRRYGLPMCRHCGFLLRGEPAAHTRCPDCARPLSEAARRTVRRSRGEWAGSASRIPPHRSAAAHV